MDVFEQSDEFVDPVTESQTVPSPPPKTQERDYDDDEIYKKWYRTGSKSGFLSIRPWFEAGKLSVDIGETSGSGLEGHTQAWTNVFELATYLQAVYDRQAATLFPVRRGVPTDESFIYYGGAQIDGRPVSRILKIHHWKTGEDSYDPGSFAWKTGHFAAKRSSSGAFIPDMSEMLSINSIKTSRLEMAEINYRVKLGLINFAAHNEKMFKEHRV